MTQEVLVEFNKNWCDEFNIHGLAIMTAEKYRKIIQLADNVTYFFGSNEGWENENFRENFTILTADPSIIKIVRNVMFFNYYDNTWGNFPNIIELTYESKFHELYEVEEVKAYKVKYRGKDSFISTDSDEAYNFAHEEFKNEFPEFNS